MTSNGLQHGMDLTGHGRVTFENENQKLEACEENLKRYHHLALAGRLVGATMHEVNNSLEALTNLIFLARASLDSASRAAQYLDDADIQVRGLAEITGRSLGFMRLDVEAKDTDLVELAAAALRLHHHQISAKRINVQTRNSEAASAFIKKGEILQVLSNLLLNAIDALPHSGNLHLRVSLRPTNAVVTIADDGHGIPQSMKGNLFKSFKSGKPEGNGLGLWIVSEIVSAHRGKIQYRSREDLGRSGTIFRITLPLKRTA